MEVPYAQNNNKQFTGFLTSRKKNTFNLVKLQGIIISCFYSPKLVWFLSGPIRQACDFCFLVLQASTANLFWFFMLWSSCWKIWKIIYHCICDNNVQTYQQYRIISLHTPNANFYGFFLVITEGKMLALCMTAMWLPVLSNKYTWNMDSSGVQPEHPSPF